MKLIQYFSRGERIFWCAAVLFITGSFFLFEGSGVLELAASLIGITSLLFAAKGNPAGPMLMIVFSLLYGYISWTFAYYGEMLTYLGMSAPMSLFSLIAWLRNPYQGNHAQVKVGHVGRRELGWMLLLSVAVTGAFYFLLRYFHTANLLPSTLSVTTSFIAVYLTGRRSPYYALAYAANDLVLIVLWLLASLTDRSYCAVLVCFVMFLCGDLYGFFNWRRMQKQQKM